jgi:hypothetical protein
MRWHRWDAQARLEDGVTERLVDGGRLQLVTVCLCDDVTGERGELASAPAVVSHLRPSEARELAFCLLELAEHAERGPEGPR